MRIARCEGFEVYKWQRLQSQIRVVGTRDCWRAFRCIPYRIMSALDRMPGLKIVLVQEISRKADECRWPWDSTERDILDLDCRQYRKIGRFVRSCLHPLHHSGILADRWKPRTIGKTAECDLKSGDPIEMQPLQLLRWSDWWFLDTALQGGGGKNLKSRHHWCDLGLWGETSRFYWDALVASPQSCAHAENLGQEILLKMPNRQIDHDINHCEMNEYESTRVSLIQLALGWSSSFTLGENALTTDCTRLVHLWDPPSWSPNSTYFYLEIHLLFVLQIYTPQKHNRAICTDPTNPGGVFPEFVRYSGSFMNAPCPCSKWNRG